MLSRLFPRTFDNHYRGHPVAIWLFVAIVIIRLLQGANSILNTRFVAMSADAIPLDRFTPDASANIVLLFALSALAFLLFALQGLLALVRYRSMIPLMYLWVLLDTLIRRAIVFTHPTIDAGPPGAHPVGFYVNMTLLALMVLGFSLSVIERPAITRIEELG
jgi:hypothetical protein